MDDLTNELQILSSADNPNIINIFEIFITPNYVDIIMEYCAGGSLRKVFNSMLKRCQSFSEYQASQIIRQVLCAVNYAHKNGIVHRDIKMENIMFIDDNSENLNLKLIDFGLSINLNKVGTKMNDRVGTLLYVSPEVLEGNYNEKCDIWSCGVMLYAMILGIFPFDLRNEFDKEKIMERIKKFEYSFTNDCKIIY